MELAFLIVSVPTRLINMTYWTNLGQAISFGSLNTNLITLLCEAGLKCSPHFKTLTLKKRIQLSFKVRTSRPFSKLEIIGEDHLFLKTWSIERWKFFEWFSHPETFHLSILFHLIHTQYLSDFTERPIVLHYGIDVLTFEETSERVKLRVISCWYLHHTMISLDEQCVQWHQRDTTCSFPSVWGFLQKPICGSGKIIGK